MTAADELWLALNRVVARYRIGESIAFGAFGRAERQIQQYVTEAVPR